MVRLVMEPAGLRIKRFVHPLPTLSLGARVGSGGGGAVMRLLRTSENDTTMSGLSKRGPSPPLAERRPRRPPGGRVLLFSYIRSCNKHRISRYSSSAPRGRTKSKQIKTFD